MNILFFYPYNQQVVYIESIAEELSKKHRIFLMTYDDWGSTHDNFKKFNAEILSVKKIKTSTPFLHHFLKVIQLVNICRKHDINITYSHYQEANLISACAQYFCDTKFILTRHHSDCAYIDNNIKEKIGDKVINRLAKFYIAPSNLVYDQIVKIEKTNPEKVIRIDYGYNFANFIEPDQARVDEIRSDFNADLLLIKAARFIEEKRHSHLLSSIKKLKDKGLNIKLLLLGKGPLQNHIESQIERLNLTKDVIILGYRKDIPNYFAAADLLVHFSLSEASNSATKEAAIVSTPVAVCNSVGDFADYINEANGFLLGKENPSEMFEKIVEEYIGRHEDLKKKGGKLKDDVERKFSVAQVIGEYEKFMN